MTPRPFRARGVEGYLDWLHDVLEHSGGEMRDPEYLQEEYIGTEDDPILVIVGPQELVFLDDSSRLNFRIVVSGEGLVQEYNFHHMKADGSLLRRLDMHSGHELLRGANRGLCHQHWPAGEHERTEPAAYYDVDDAIRILRYGKTPTKGRPRTPRSRSHGAHSYGFRKRLTCPE